MTKSTRRKSMPQFDSIACCLQGGGSMGAYQVGVLHALQEGGYNPDWFIGTSIGAINSAIAVGNAVEDRIDKLKAFWARVATPSLIDTSNLPENAVARRMQRMYSSQLSILFGQPNFFTPRFPAPHPFMTHQNPETLSYYDTAPLRRTLEEFIDFERINHGNARLSVGAVEVKSGKMTYFDSKKHPITVDHIMASASLPPGFPAINIDGTLYWDGGLSSNSPGSYLFTVERPKSLLCFLVHLFDSYGMLPHTLDDIEKRKKDIEYCSRFQTLMDLHLVMHELRYTLHQLKEHIPAQKQNMKWVKASLENNWDKTISLVRFLYQGDETEWSTKDCEFSEQSIREHIEKGYYDGKMGVNEKPWMEPVPVDLGILLHDMSERKTMNKE